MKFAIVGTGYVADQYPATLGNHPDLQLTGVWDQNPRHLEGFLRRWPTRRYEGLDELLADDRVELVLNLTNPRSHFEVTSRCLNAGKHVYSEKPLGMTVAEAQSLAELAARQNRLLASAPCSVLSESAQTLMDAVRRGQAGRIRLVYAAFDDGMIAPRQKPWTWHSESGVPWPASDEFEVGCTYEHAGYVLTWLIALFGPVQAVTSFAACLIPDKGIPVETMAPDFTVGCLQFADGVVARVTCGLVAPRDKSLTVVGDDGTLFVGNVRNDVGPVFFRPARLTRFQARIDQRTRWLQKWLEGRLGYPGADCLFQQRLPQIGKTPARLVSRSKPVDFLRGPAEMAASLRENRPCRLSADLAVHLVEVVERLQYPERFAGDSRMITSVAATR